MNPSDAYIWFDPFEERTMRRAAQNRALAEFENGRTRTYSELAAINTPEFRLNLAHSIRNLARDTAAHLAACLPASYLETHWANAIAEAQDEQATRLAIEVRAHDVSHSAQISTSFSILAPVTITYSFMAVRP